MEYGTKEVEEIYKLPFFSKPKWNPSVCTRRTGLWAQVRGARRSMGQT